ncbi:MAG: LptF/LptG family permease [Candidatus Azobacteroides sp.]|nr:LptF/LptG family permease [Candidatus Azobacteroides sp.]
MKLKLSIIDWYIIKKFLGTYIFTVFLFIAITVIIDVNQKFDDFIKNSASAHAIIFDYYLNFIPYFINAFSSLFVFIAVIFFTSKLADNSEIIAMLSSGLSFDRLVVPYLISASIIAVLTFGLNSYVIPPGNVKRIEFENKYVKDRKTKYAPHIQIEVDPGVYAYFSSFNNYDNRGNGFSLDRFEGKELVSRLTAQSITWDSAYHWTINSYIIRNFEGMKETITKGEKADTILAIMPSDFLISIGDSEQLTTPELKTYIDRQKKRGIGNIQQFEIEYYKRFATSFASFILTIIGVSLSSRKVKGGMGMNIGLGLLLSFSYILFMQITSTFAVSGLVSPWVAVWIPNVVYTFVAAFLYKKAPR